jgi:hypothetical protein
MAVDVCTSLLCRLLYLNDFVGVDTMDDDMVTSSFLDADHHSSYQVILPIQAIMFPCLRGIGMARGRRTSLIIRLNAQERRTLQAWQRSRTISAGRARRGQVILLMADQVPISHIAAMVGVSRRFVYKWVQRFLQAGLAGLDNKPGRGRRQERFDQDDRGA